DAGSREMSPTVICARRLARAVRVSLMAPRGCPKHRDNSHSRSRTRKGKPMKQPLRITTVGIAWMLACSIVVTPTPGAAAPSYSGTITGVFDSLVLSGAFLRAGTHLPVVRDNTSTAGGSGIGTSSVVWSDDNVHAAAPSTVTFTGTSFSSLAPDQVFPLGTLTYFNGSNGPTSLIFGVTMHLSAGGSITPFTAPVAVVSTQNGNLDRVADADSLFFSNFEIP